MRAVDISVIVTNDNYAHLMEKVTAVAGPAPVSVSAPRRAARVGARMAVAGSRHA